MANTIQSVMTGITESRDRIKTKLDQMGVGVADPGKLYNVSMAINTLAVDDTTKTVEVSIGEEEQLPKGYYTNPIDVKCKSKSTPVEITKEDILTTEYSDPTFTVPLADDTYASSITVAKIGLGEYTVPANQLYNEWDGSEGDLVVTPSDIIDSDETDDFYFEGLSKVIIPRPAVEDASSTVDILNAENVDAEDITVTITPGYKSESVITIETKEIYDALAAI